MMIANLIVEVDIISVLKYPESHGKNSVFRSPTVENPPLVPWALADHRIPRNIIRIDGMKVSLESFT
jgi:hypothetical protein